MDNTRVYINRVVHYHPDGVLENSHFESKLDTTSEWIRSRVGIETRRYLNDYRGEFPVFEMARRAVERLGERSSWNSESIDAIISCSTFDDISYPNPANMISEWLSLRVPSFQLKSACTSVVYGLQVARSLLMSNTYKRILIVNGEPFTLQADYGDRASCILFGDASSAMILSTEPGGYELKNVELGGVGLDIVGAHRKSPTSGVSIREFVTGKKERRAGVQSTIARIAATGKFDQYGKEVTNFVLSKIPSAVDRFLKVMSISPSEIDSAIFHQANLTIMNDLCISIGIPLELHRYNINRYGNTSSAGWVTAFSEENQKGTFSAGHKILVSTFGAGMTWGTALLVRV